MTIPRQFEVAERLAALIRIPTVTPQSRGPHDAATAATFEAFHEALRGFYPRVFGHEVVEVARAGLLIHIPGADAARPVLLMAHQDVVPVPRDWEAEGWEHAPFDGVIEDGWVHGRGALDDKGALVVMLEAVESLLAERVQLSQDLWILMGADEESSGDCASTAAAYLTARGVTPWLVLDEGGAITTGAIPGLKGEAAMIGVSEKGTVDVRLTVEGRGGHASTPPRASAPGILARALAAIEAHPHPAILGDVPVEMLEAVGTRAKGPVGALLRRAPGLRGPLAALLPRVGPELAAMVRTTVAITQLEGSPAHNVLATRATAVLNVRVAVGSSVEEAVAHLRAVVDDARVTFAVEVPSEPSPVSPRGDDARWLALGEAVRVAYRDALVLPYVMLAASDARHLAPISGAVYRFAPLRMSKVQREAVHGPNEKVEVDSLGRGVTFYRELLTSARLA